MEYFAGGSQRLVQHADKDDVYSMPSKQQLTHTDRADHNCST